jgi:crotonobetainyl-CoA:carnitine CoA-transferase CaiB-like acyl-CoA transferase
MANLSTLVSELSGVFAEKPTAVWLELLQKAGVPAGPIASIGEMLELPQTLAREMVVETNHVLAGRVRSLGSPVKMSGTGSGAVTSAAGRPAPALGQHTREVLTEAGFTSGEIDGLLRRGVAQST